MTDNTDPNQKQFKLTRESSRQIDNSTQDLKTLLLYASSGAGHKNACLAIEQALRNLGYQGFLQSIDILDHMPMPLAKLFSKGYLYVATKLPWLWYAIYESKSDMIHFKPPSELSNIFWKLALWKVNRLLRNIKPDYIVSAYFTSSWAAGRYKNTYNPACRVATVVTDYGLHPAWMIPGQDRYFVATEDNKIEMAGFEWYTGVKSDKIKVVGIPVEQRFAGEKDKFQLREKYKLDRDRFTVIVLAGVYGIEHIESIVEKLANCTAKIQILIVAKEKLALNEKLAARLSEKEIICQTYGRITFMHELMALSDIAITKTGGLTSTECFNSGCPLFIYLPYPGQEERNSSLFLEKGAAWRIYQLESLPHKINKLAQDPQLHAVMVKAARELANPSGAFDIASAVLNDLATK